jgi:hypothetical protein
MAILPIEVTMCVMKVTPLLLEFSDVSIISYIRVTFRSDLLKNYYFLTKKCHMSQYDIEIEF